MHAGKNKMNKLDIFIQNYLVSSRTPELNNFFYFVTSFFDVSFLFFLLTMLVIYFVHQIRGRNYSIFFLSNIFITMGLVYVLKEVFDTSRPVDALTYAFGASFPSYHATMSTVFFISLYFTFKDKIGGFYKKALYFFSFIIVFLVAFSRIYLGVHWLSDVVLGVVLGVIISCLSVRLFKKYRYIL